MCHTHNKLLNPPKRNVQKENISDFILENSNCCAVPTPPQKDDLTTINFSLEFHQSLKKT